METIFSKIILGEIPCEKVYEDDHVFAFLDNTPVNPGHTLVLPKKWSSDFLDIDEETLKYVIIAVQKIAKAVMDATGAEGINIAQNNRAAAGQKVFHLHFHVIPRFEGDGFEHWHGKGYESPEQEKELGEKIRKVL